MDSATDVEPLWCIGLKYLGYKNEKDTVPALSMVTA